MSTEIEIQQAGDVIYTMRGGVLRAFRVTASGDLGEIDASDALLAE